MHKPQAAGGRMDCMEVPYRPMLYVASRIVTSQRVGETSTVQVSYHISRLEPNYYITYRATNLGSTAVVKEDFCLSFPDLTVASLWGFEPWLMGVGTANT